MQTTSRVASRFPPTPPGLRMRDLLRTAVPVSYTIQTQIPYEDPLSPPSPKPCRTVHPARLRVRSKRGFSNPLTLLGVFLKRIDNSLILESTTRCYSRLRIVTTEQPAPWVTLRTPNVQRPPPSPLATGYPPLLRLLHRMLTALSRPTSLCHPLPTRPPRLPLFSTLQTPRAGGPRIAHQAPMPSPASSRRFTIRSATSRADS